MEPKFLELKIENGWEYVVRRQCRGAVMVLVHNIATDKFLAVEQYRPPVQMRLLECPAGLVDDGEELHAAAVREVKEETGITLSPADLVPLGRVYGSAGISNESVYLFAATTTETSIAPAHLDDSEKVYGLTARWVERNDLLTTSAAKTVATLARYEAWQKDNSLVF